MTALRDHPRALLINAPFGLVEFPHLGTSLIKAATCQAGFVCDVWYTTVEFAHVIGFAEYLNIERSACPMLLPERPFARLLSENIPSADEYFRTVVQPFGERLFPFVHNDLQIHIGCDSIKRIEAQAAVFTAELVQRPQLAAYDVIAFSSSYGQHVASLAIAKCIKERHPRALIAFGGANCEGAMGKQLVRSFPFVDYAFSGDGDVSFPLFLAALARGDTVVRLPGVYHRDTLAADGSDLTAPLTRQNLNELPYPDYGDYFEAVQRVPDGAHYCMGIPVEGSRGCWWGEKHHCTFCGLNGLTMKYRAKTPQRFQAELRHLVERYDQRDVMAADNILDWKAFTEWLPALKADRAHRVLFFEIKANLKKPEVEALADAGITHIQPGIESLSTHVLTLMDKGTTSLQNVQLLKWAEEFGITLTWNILCGFPGETPDDYAQMATLMQKIPHLQPPGAFARISIDRFSPYFDFPERYGLKIRPSIAYSYVYDLRPDEIENLAYWYSYTCANGSSHISLEPPAYARHALRVRAIWLRAYNKVGFRYTIADNGRVHLEDTRPGALDANVELDALASRIFVLADTVVERQALCRQLSQCGNGGPFGEPAISAALEELEARQILHREGDRYLALATSATSRVKAPALGECCIASL